MTHEVIMPALGMAQDSGKIVSWLKAAGDPVAEGDALFEVETDKATMEVEAQAAGFLTDVTASAGDDVPVGQVIALISETATDKAAPADASPNAAPDKADTTSSDAAAIPKGAEIIMPVLGMAQDSGRLVAWAKAPGAAVAADDVLFEVETDKSTMEVPAGADGYLAAVLADAGEDIPTGQVIAVITTEKPDTPYVGGAKAAPSAPASQSAPTAAPAQPTAPKPAATPSDGRILASPKARRLALAAGLDLGRLVAAGHPQPYHAADIEVLRTLPEVGRNAPTAPALHQITAQVPRAGTDEFVAWMLEDGGITLAPARLWASFAAGALRAARADAGDIILDLAPLTGPSRTVVNPDKTRLSQDPPSSDAAPDLVLRDLTDSPITGLRLCHDGAPCLTMASSGETLRLTLEFGADRLDDATATSLILGFAERLADPLHHLL